jgi:two-component system, sensor histidine kinase and response regulator
MEESISILVVDDNQENLRVVSNFLREKNYRIALATSGENALQILEQNKIDLILLDVMMPEMDGFTVCRNIKAKETLKDIPVIFLTARNDTNDIVKGFQAGGVDYITKPFRKEELFVRVINHLQLKIARDILRAYAEHYKESRDSLLSQVVSLGRLMESSKKHE